MEHSMFSFRSAILLVFLIGAALFIFGLSGCASLDLTTADQYGEVAFQAEHLVDTLQTIHGAAQDPCYSEGDPFTKRIIGSKPSEGAVIAWGIGYGGLHYGITEWLLDHQHDRIAAVWQVASIVDTASVINHNYSLGIRIGAPNKDPAGCTAYFNGNVPTGGPTAFSKHE